METLRAAKGTGKGSSANQAWSLEESEEDENRKDLGETPLRTLCSLECHNQPCKKWLKNRFQHIQEDEETMTHDEPQDNYRI